MQQRPWRTNQLKRLGLCIRDEIEVPADLPDYLEVMSWYNDLAAEIQKLISAVDWTPIIGLRSVEVISRPKTIDTLRQKLQRDHNTPLQNIQDIAGVRVEADMNLDEQDQVVRAIEDAMPSEYTTSVRDMREDPHSGYRAVHIWVRAEGGRAEIQIRTHVQGLWANMYEAAGDMLGRGIRYGEMPDSSENVSLVLGLQSLSIDAAAKIESTRTRLDRLDEEDRGRSGSHSSSNDRTAIVRERRSLRRQHKKSEHVFKEGMKTLRETFQNSRDSE